MTHDYSTLTLCEQFEGCFGAPPDAIASAPGRIEVLGNHTDYNAGLTLSCAVALRCYVAIGRGAGDSFQLASTAFDSKVHSYSESAPAGEPGDWGNYVLGLIAGLRERRIVVPGFSMLIDSAVPSSAGLSSSAALEMAALTAMTSQIHAELSPLELARIGQHAESTVAGARTGLLDQLSSLLGQRDHLLQIDFQDCATRSIPMPQGYCFVCIDSGVKHDLTAEYNERRLACEEASRMMGVATLRQATPYLLESSCDKMPPLVYGCAKHILDENARVSEACDALKTYDIRRFGQLMYDSHESSRGGFRNSCAELDALIEMARRDARCLGARLSGGGFGGITIHLVRQEVAEAYRSDMVQRLTQAGVSDRWSAVCALDRGAMLHDG